MAIKIQSTDEIKIDSVKSVVYGGAGVGKTRLCATAPNPIIVSAESGLLSLADVSCAYIEVSSLKEFDECYRFMRSSDEAKQYETCCLDSLSEIAEVLLEKILPSYKDPRQAYAELANSMLPMLRKFRDLKGTHTVFTSKLVTVQDEETDKVTQELMLPGKVLPNQVPYMVDELFCLQTDRKGNAFLQTSPDRTRFAKDRSGALDKEEKPDMTVIINKIMSKASKSKLGN
jgi:hypothetical protein